LIRAGATIRVAPPNVSPAVSKKERIQHAEEASSIARQITDPEAIQITGHIVQGYEILAEHAKKRTLRNKSFERKSG
jgi:hypothetical protein